MFVLFELFAAFLRVGALAFGGGYSVLPMIRETVLSHGWLTAGQFADVAAFSEVTPGPVTLNAASYAGFVTAGLPGAIAATVGCVLPSLPAVAFLLLLRKRFREHPLYGGFFGGLRPAVCALIFAAFCMLLFSSVFFGASAVEILTGKASVNAAALLIFSGAFVLARSKAVPPAALILFCGVCGAVMA
ncbi:MAG: chromate transporter [Ruminococcaceae bacterium]|jgi:chromate transporter|nr:chromate transporter [Oscillospiraceae bacterium]